jgi:LPS export ABC transporter protein LptC
MKKKQQKVQLVLFVTGLFLFIATYLYYPSINQVKSPDKVTEKKDDEAIIVQDGQNTSFENIEYQGVYNLNNTFTVKSEKAYILDENSDLVYMTNMHVILYLDEGRVVNITSSEGKYNKLTYDCIFEKNVKATDGDTKINAENLDLLATQDTVAIYNKVFLQHNDGSLQADKIDYNFETKNFKVSMFNDKKIKMKIIR